MNQYIVIYLLMGAAIAIAASLISRQSLRFRPFLYITLMWPLVIAIVAYVHATKRKGRS